MNSNLIPTRMPRAGLTRLLVAALPLAAAAALLPPARGDELLDSRADVAIDRGIEYLLHAVEGEAGWIPMLDTRNVNEFSQGYAALQVYALVKSDVSFQHPAVVKGIAAMEASSFVKVYSVSLLLMAYGAMVDQIDAESKAGGSRGGPERAKFLERMNAALAWLLAARLQGAGAWNYEPYRGKDSPRAARYDHSNSQFAALALGVAAEKGLKVPREVWGEIADHFIATQEKEGALVAARPSFRDRSAAGKGERETPLARIDDPAKDSAKEKGGEGTTSGGKTSARKVHPLYSTRGNEAVEVHARGWRYSNQGDEPLKLSMACAGVSTLLLCQRNLGPSPPGDPRGEALRRAVRDGLGDLTLRLDPEANPSRRTFVLLYDLYSLEKVGDIGEVESLGSYRWYDEGVRRLLRDQRGDGGWGPKAEEALVRPDTSFALLFLSRASELHGRSHPLVRVTSVAGVAGVAGVGGIGAGVPAGAGWIYLPSQKAEVPLTRLFRIHRYRPSKGVSRLVEEAAKVCDPERIHEIAAALAVTLEITPFSPTRDESRKLLARLTGVESNDAKTYREWARRFAEAVRIGKEKEADRLELLRDWLRTSDGTPLKARVIWALERTEARAAVGDLVELLEAADPALREAAHSTLVFLSGQDLPFHPRGSENERRGEVKGWKDWLAGDGQKLLK